MSSRPDKILKVKRILLELHSRLKTKTYLPVSSFFRENECPSEYGKILVDEGVIIKIDSGGRGATSYVWNDTKKPTDELAEFVLRAYSQCRTRQRTNCRATTRKTINQNLVEIKDLLMILINRLPDQNSAHEDHPIPTEIIQKKAKAH